MKLPIWFWHWFGAAVTAPLWVPFFVCDVVKTKRRERDRPAVF
jgi:hypothetical protein